MKSISSKRRAVFELLTLRPKGKVSTYRDIAKKIGSSARAVGTILHSNTDTQKYPCHRVVKSDGSLATGYAFGGQKEQMRKLIEEGVIFKHGKVIL